MDREVPRRNFLKTAQAAVGMLACGQGTAANTADQPKVPAAAVTISGAAYTPVLDYPIQPKRYSEVRLQDAFWEPRIATNAKVTGCQAAGAGRGQHSENEAGRGQRQLGF